MNADKPCRCTDCDWIGYADDLYRNRADECGALCPECRRVETIEYLVPEVRIQATVTPLEEYAKKKDV